MKPKLLGFGGSLGFVCLGFFGGVGQWGVYSPWLCILFRKIMGLAHAVCSSMSTAESSCVTHGLAVSTEGSHVESQICQLHGWGFSVLFLGSN